MVTIKQIKKVCEVFGLEMLAVLSHLIATFALHPSDDALEAYEVSEKKVSMEK